MTWFCYHFSPESYSETAAKQALLAGLNKLAPEQARTALTYIYNGSGNSGNASYPVLIYNESPGSAASAQDLSGEWGDLQYSFGNGVDATVKAVCDLLNGKTVAGVTLGLSQASLAKCVMYGPHLVVYYPKSTSQQQPQQQPKPLLNGEVIALRASNGQYLSRSIQSDSADDRWVLANKPSIDETCRFTVDTSTGGGITRLKTDTNDYLYVSYQSTTPNVLAWGPGGTYGPYSYFIVYELDNDQIALKAYETNKYFSFPGSTTNEGLEANAPGLNESCILKLTRLS